ncbi:LPS export ABC transporter permease LptF [Roseomonas sp. AR75]|jgi:lipopolysaccharide export system permease protein|uniref:LPS export ABC transporter permease LptF n=1 Tax=Roseomonas sp. AR75 TaxID=2562311 RepID=UPI0010BF9A04|nr:LPS export ABC transporter permease LptF [Roseomonas sp. AR75]
MTRIDRYIFRQLAGGLLAVTAGLAALVWLTQSLRFIELVLDRGLSLGVFIELTSLMLPGFVAVILPITTFVVVLFVYVRMNSDRELVVMRAAGLSPMRLARPAITLAAISVAIGYLLNMWLVPLSHGAFRMWQFEIRNQMAAILLQEGVFSSVGNDLTVYARARERDGTLRGILVHDQREPGAPVTIIAEQGRITTTPQGPRVLLINGVREQMEQRPNGQPPRLNALSFAENSVDLARATRQEEVRARDSRERSIPELLDPDPEEGLRPRDVARFYGEAHQRMSAPLTALSYALVALAVALTGQFRRHGGGLRLAAGIGITVALLAVGLTIGNLATRENSFVWLVWVHAIAPGVIALWWMIGAPGLPRQRARTAAA